jgi:D-alanyl-D-alanine carboxypeptidase
MLKRFLSIIIIMILCTGCVTLSPGQSPDGSIPNKETQNQNQGGNQTEQNENPNEGQVQEQQNESVEIYNSRDEILLVNAENPLPRDYKPAELKKIEGTEYQVYPAAADAVARLIKDAEKDGITDFKVFSAYRTYNYQDKIYKNKTEELKPTFGDSAAVEAAKIVAIPGQSEHQTGLAVDLSSSEIGLERVFGESETGKWLEDNCYKYGFIIRYPVDKTDITKIIYEPWHIRYVGVKFATEIHEQGVCLEEYAPFGVIGAITPSTHPIETMANNIMIMTAGGNAVVFNPHPGAKKCTVTALQIYHKAVVAGGFPANIFACVKNPTLEPRMSCSPIRTLRSSPSPAAPAW